MLFSKKYAGRKHSKFFLGILVVFQAGVYSPVVKAEEDLEKKQLIRDIESEKSRISTRFDELERERDRNGKLIAAMNRDGKFGCWEEEPITKLELIFEASKIGNKSHGREESRASSEGNPSVFEFGLGEVIGFSNNEEDRATFVTGGRLVRNDFSDLKIKDIEFIRIAKAGAGFDNDRNCETKKSGPFGVFGSKEKCRYEVMETHRYQLDSLEIRVNGETLYKNGSINWVFEKGNLEFRDDSFKLNEYYQQLMGREDCS